MSTTPIPGQSSQPPSSWFPNLKGSGLPRTAINGLQQSFSLIYSLRDTLAQLETTVRNLVQYGTNQERTQVNGGLSAQAVPDGALYFETDTGQVFQSRLNPNSTTRDWFLVINGVVPGP